MKRLILLVTHLNSQSEIFCETLNNFKRIHWVKDKIVYDYPEIVNNTCINHKYSDEIGLYLNEVFYNYQISHKSVYKICNFIFFIRNPKEFLEENSSYEVNYYIFRLRRMFEIAKHLKSVILVNKEDMYSGLQLVKHNFNLTENVKFEFKNTGHKSNYSKEAYNAYNLFLNRFSHFV